MKAIKILFSAVLRQKYQSTGDISGQQIIQFMLIDYWVIFFFRGNNEEIGQSSTPYAIRFL